MSRRIAIAALLAACASLALAGTALGHPLGNYTVNRAVAVSRDAGGLTIAYVIDMAEIPAFAAREAIDRDASGTLSSNEERAWALATCDRARNALAVAVDARPLSVAAAGGATLTFPPGAGGLETLRLECPLHAAWAGSAGTHELTVADRTADGHIGWREITIAAAGWRLTSSSAPATSPSKHLTAYPVDSLAAPPTVTSASATFELTSTRGLVPPSSTVPSVGPRSTASDPFAALIGGDLTLPAIALALLIAAGLGALHALSPGHGKTLVAAYLLGSRATPWHAVGLGLTVAVTHTIGVFLIGALTLAASELFLPERIIGWLSVVSGGLVAVLGAALVYRALRPRRHAHQHDHQHGNSHPHPHPTDAPAVSIRGLLALGLAGGMVPSASALIVLLAAVSTGRLVFGIGLIIAFGLGMALVLAALAAAATVARRAMVRPHGFASGPIAKRVSTLMPVASGVAVLVIGAVVTISAVARMG